MPHHLVVPFVLKELRTGRLSELESEEVQRVYPGLPRQVTWNWHAQGVKARRLYLENLDRVQRGFRCWNFVLPTTNEVSPAAAGSNVERFSL